MTRPILPSRSKKRDRRWFVPNGVGVAEGPGDEHDVPVAFTDDLIAHVTEVGLGVEGLRSTAASDTVGHAFESPADSIISASLRAVLQLRMVIPL